MIDEFNNLIKIIYFNLTVFIQINNVGSLYIVYLIQYFVNIYNIHTNACIDLIHKI